ncbi:hypothetical protein D3C71_1826190 [compost metagenome]
MLVSKAVIFFIKRTVVNAERAGEIENHTAGRQELRCQVVANFVGGGQKHHIHTVGKLADVGHRLQRQIHDSLKLRMQIRN